MKILFDFLAIYQKNGAAEYTRRVFYALLDRIEHAAHTDDITITCLFDSHHLPAYTEMRPDSLRHKYVDFVDIQNGISAINAQNYDVFFFGCAQNAGWNPQLEELTCKSILVFHDCVWEEFYNNDINLYLAHNANDMFHYRATGPRGKKDYWDIKSPTIRFCRWLLHVRRHGVLEDGYNMLQPALALLRKREDNVIMTVSNYSKSSIMYNFNVKEDKIHVKYSPERIYTEKKSDAKGRINEKLKRLVDGKVKYYLMVSANRDAKNAKKALHAFESFTKIKPDMYAVTVGYGKTLFKNHIDLPFLNDIDLREAYKNCYALLYPSLFEGFGYPPLEAMKYGKPILASNVCSIPEVLGDAPVYFSPIYETAIFNALMVLNDDNYSEFAEKSLQRYQQIHEKQESDLTDLVNMILGVDNK